MTAMVSDFGKELIAIIQSKDAAASLAKVQLFSEQMRDVAHGAEYVTWITEPVNLTSVHKALTEHLGILPRAMAIKRATISRTRKAMLLVQAMELAIKRVHNL